MRLGHVVDERTDTEQDEVFPVLGFFDGRTNMGRGNIWGQILCSIGSATYSPKEQNKDSPDGFS